MGPSTHDDNPSTVDQDSSARKSDADDLPKPGSQPADPAFPVRLNRYHITAKLGEGGFGIVYKAFDEELQRYVALKVPHRHRIALPEDMELYVAEARTLASLDHPGIVPVYDVGRTDDGLCYVVSKYIEGSDLRACLKQGRLPRLESVQIVACVAEALHHAHQRRLVHRDIKPANILLDLDGNPIVVDFGLALREEDFGKDPMAAGTPGYMSPEQARGEGHRVDARSDVYSLGVVLYELLVGQRPFALHEPDLLEQLQTKEPRPPRQLDDSIPRELDRICLKALATLASDRHSTALDLAEDLRHWLATTKSHPESAIEAEAVSPSVPRPAAASATAAPVSDTDGRSIVIVPKGLRSFDADDADFFLELLPGPRGWDRLPDSIRFWKKRLETTDPDKAFPVGLLYGPSGCGKSSLIKAGLLPNLSASVLAVYVEAAPEHTETRLLNALRRRCPQLPGHLDLVQTLTLLRRGKGLPAGKKVLLVLDQFEQWLHAKSDEQIPALVQALRQCDGEHLQALVLVRDDFWMATTRFMRDLEVPLVEGQNSVAVDLFNLRHARKVLTAFGRALGALPEGEMTQSHGEFLDRAVAGLAQDGKVIPVRLSLFAQMVQGNPWLPATLTALGGAEGVGVTFLEQTFSGASAPPEHRLHQKGARAILQALLPESGTDIKGNMRSRQELLEASGYAARPKEFTDLVRILDSELRLVTPSDPEGPSDEAELNADATPGPLAPGDSGLSYYQLTHDYLVPVLREWLTRKQKETWRGRAALTLEQRTAQWSRSLDRRLLPSLPEYLLLVFGVPRAKRKPAERALMQAAARHHGLQWSLVLFGLVVTGVTLQQYISSVHLASDRERVGTLVDLVANAAPQDVPAAIDQFGPMRDLAMPLLLERFHAAPADSSQRFHYALALAALGTVEEEFLLERIATTPVNEARNLMSALAFAKATIAPRLRERVESDPNAEIRSRSALILLHLGDVAGAQRTLALTPDPAARTAFIHGFPTWHGNLRALPDVIVKTDDAAFQSGLCAALGLTDPTSLAADERDGFEKVLDRLYRETPDGGVHGAAGWALRQWGRQLPPLPTSASAPLERGWFVNRHGLTMLAIRQGAFKMGDPHAPGAPSRLVTLSRSFFLSDREVSSDLFQRFLNDPAYPVEKKPDNRRQPKRGNPPAGNSAANMVSWLDAVLFCNWLSASEGRQTCYTVNPQADGQKGDDQIKECDFQANGYRLPTEAEWEYACRAGTQTTFSFGNDARILPSYGFFILNSDEHPRPGGMKLPNRWGLFDMHGNVAEWCWDWYGALPGGNQTDPRGAMTGVHRVVRGGDGFSHALELRSGNRSVRAGQSSRTLQFGFRVLCPSMPSP